jgi:mRNA interferase MazF
MSVKKWTIYRANLDPTIGSEQGKTRPVLVISEDEINCMSSNQSGLFVKECFKLIQS